MATTKKVFCNFPTTARYLQHRYNVTKEIRIGPTDASPSRLSAENPAFSVSAGCVWAGRLKNG